MWVINVSVKNVTWKELRTKNGKFKNVWIIYVIKKCESIKCESKKF